MFNKFNQKFNSKDVNGLRVVSCNVDPGPLIHLKNDLEITLEYADLIERIDNKTCVLRIRPVQESALDCAAHDAEFVLGLPFLQVYCLTYDYQRHNVGVALNKEKRRICQHRGTATTATTALSRTTTTAATTTSAAARATSTPTRATSSSKNTAPSSSTVTSLPPPLVTSSTPSEEAGTLSPLEIGLIVVAAIVAGFAALLGGYCFLRYRRRRNKGKSHIHPATPNRYQTQDLAWTVDDNTTGNEWQISANDLTIETQIGSGAFARVFLGTLVGPKHEMLKHRMVNSGGPYKQTKVAVKAPRKPSENVLRDLDRELQLMQEFGVHSHVVELIGYAKSPTTVLVMEYCPNGNLLSFLRNRLQAHKKALNSAKEKLQLVSYANLDISLKTLMSFCWQISDGMEFLSSKGYIHRDLAARNILLSAGLVAKISDFGLCRYTDEDLYVTQCGGRLPLRWMASESLAEIALPQTWSFGVLLFEIFSAGDVPYQPTISFGEDQSDELLKFLQEGSRLPQPVLCPVDIYGLMQQCWLKLPHERPCFEEIRSFLENRLEYLDEGGYGYVMAGKDWNVQLAHDPSFSNE